MEDSNPNHHLYSSSLVSGASILLLDIAYHLNLFSRYNLKHNDFNNSNSQHGQMGMGMGQDNSRGRRMLLLIWWI